MGSQEWKKKGRGGDNGDGLGRTNVDVNAAFEEAAQDFEDIGSLHVKIARESQAFRYVLDVEHRLGHALFEEAELGALRDGVADGQLYHVVGPAKQRDHVVENARALDIIAIFEVKLLRLKVRLVERPRD
jgi:hypothetical protein